MTITTKYDIGQEVFFDPTAALDAIDAKNYSVERMY